MYGHVRIHDALFIAGKQVIRLTDLAFQAVLENPDFQTLINGFCRGAHRANIKKKKKAFISQNYAKLREKPVLSTA